MHPAAVREHMKELRRELRQNSKKENIGVTVSIITKDGSWHNQHFAGLTKKNIVKIQILETWKGEGYGNEILVKDFLKESCNADNQSKVTD